MLSFAKLAEARAHAKAGNGPAAARALSRAEDLLAAVRDDGRHPQWLDYYTRARLASDATESHLDLVNPRSALAWSAEADAMPSGRYTRATGIRLAVTASAHLQHRDLDQGLAVGRRPLGILGSVESSRARDYLRQFARGLEPWEKDPRVRAFLREGRPALHRAA
ncbi:hypothetical protein [Kitasatospora sp. NPDC050463]|uniref:hypothetical protein n=1 Tax=Kitasatospora sp. NPDC050463 TaxID=3155786 RepID=UPI0033FB8ADB